MKLFLSIILPPLIWFLLLSPFILCAGIVLITGCGILWVALPWIIGIGLILGLGYGLLRIFAPILNALMNSSKRWQETRANKILFKIYSFISFLFLLGVVYRSVTGNTIQHLFK